MITLDLPAPYSVNRTRKVNWGYIAAHKRWMLTADVMVVKAKQHEQKPILGQYQVHFTIDDAKVRSDPDNIIKSLLDYVAKHLRLVTDDSSKYIRKYTVEYGYAPEGVRIIIQPFQRIGPFVTGYRRQMMVDYLFARKSGVSVDQIVSAVYANDGNGGPDRRCVPKMARDANKQLKDQGWRITATGGPGSVYRLEPIQRVSD